MTISSITTTLITGVTLGATSFGNDLFITSNGAIVQTNGPTLSTALYVGSHLAGVTVVNEGKILSQTTFVTNGGIGFSDYSGSYLRNDGLLDGSFVGALFKNSGQILNTGTVSSEGTGILLFAGAQLDNESEITTSGYGVVLNNSAMTNHGSVYGAVDGVVLSHGDNVLYNFSSISGGSIGVYVLAGGTIVDDGYIGGGSEAIVAAGGFDLILNAHSQLHGGVAAGGSGTLVLTGTTAGSIQIGPSLTGFNQFSFGSNSAWTLEGSATNLASGQLITGMDFGDTIVLDGFAASYGAFVPGSGLVLTNATASATLDIVGTFSGGECRIGVNVNGGTNIQVPCFLRGTRIATIDGDVTVESLRIGSELKTMHQGWARIKWIGTRRYNLKQQGYNRNVQPIRIRKDALFENVPCRDLFLSPDHSICEGGVLIAAWRLLNGVSITQADGIEDIEYFHVELECHDVIFADNCPVETFLDLNCRERFSNCLDYYALYKHSEPPKRACLPRLEGGFYLDIIQQRTAARAGVSRPCKPIGPLRGYIDEIAGDVIRGWAQDEAAPEHPVQLDLYHGHQRVGTFLANHYRADLEAAEVGSGCHAFEIQISGSLNPKILRIQRSIDGAVLVGPKKPEYSMTEERSYAST